MSSPNVKEDGDDVKVYTADDIRSAVSLTAGGMLLLAILCGGDYDSVSYFILYLLPPIADVI